MRKNGSIGLFRAFGANMDIYMGSILAGENAETPSPFDFALGGGGIDASCPLGANGTLLKEGTAIMVDMAGNCYGLYDGHDPCLLRRPPDGESLCGRIKWPLRYNRRWKTLPDREPPVRIYII